MHNDLMYFSHVKQNDILSSRIQSASGMTDEIERELALAEMYNYNISLGGLVKDIADGVLAATEVLRNVSRSMHMQNIKTI